MVETTAIVNGIVITVDPDNRIIEDGCVIIEGDRIVDLGRTDEIAHKYRKDLVLDARKHAILPGLVNIHCHSGLIRGTAEDMRLWDWLKFYVDPKHRVLTEDDAYIAASLCYLEGIKAGTTCTLDMYRYMHRCADAAAKLGNRVVLAPYVSDKYDYFDKPEDNYRLLSQRHGSANGRVIVWLGLEHLMYCTEEAFRKAAEYAAKYRVGIHTHGEESKEMAEKITKEYGKRPVQVFEEYGILGPRTVLAHCVWLDDREIQTLAETRTSVAHCPTSNLKLASGIARVPEMIASGVNVGLGSDGIKENNRIDLFQEMKLAGLIQKVKHSDATVMRAPNLLRMATIDGARALGMEEEIGSLEKGKKGDVILIDLKKPHLSPILSGEFFNVVNNIVYAAMAEDVSTTLVDGKVLMLDRVVENVNEQKLMEEARVVTASLLERRKQFLPPR
jgi:5-methylthioadenosine/S-adenosylhomocysteine deaminase